MKKVLSPISDTKMSPNAAVNPCARAHSVQNSGEGKATSEHTRAAGTCRLGQDVNQRLPRRRHEGHGRLWTKQ